MRVRLRVLVPGTRVRVRRPGRGERGRWVVGDRLVGSGLHDPAYELRQERSGRARILRRSRLRLTRTRQLDDQEAAQRRRAWLEDRHRWNRDLVVVLLRYAPEVDVTRALDQLPDGELHRLARLLAQATDLHQVARRIAADLQEHLDGQPAGPPPGQPGPSAATPTHP